MAADVADAERRITELDLKARVLANTEALARMLLRAESVASSKIEGLVVSPQRLLKADAVRTDGIQTNDMTALEVLANIDAMTYAIENAESTITLEAVCEFNKRLLAPTALAAHGGNVRTQQNWIGGTSFNPFGATFVPPPPEELPALLTDLFQFCNDDSLPTVAQAAIAHAQFETIHPFADGNGRTGRALIYMIFKKRGLATRTFPPVSLILATQANDYIAALQATRYEGSPDSSQSLTSTDDWVGLFAGACIRAVSDAEAFESRIGEIQEEWQRRLGSLRADSTALALLDKLPVTPVVTVRSVEQALSVSYSSANAAIDALVSSGVLIQTNVGRRNRAFEAREIVDAFTGLERQMASVDGNTLLSEPVRSVPSSPRR